MSQSEFSIIRRYFAESGLDFTREGVVAGIGDDAALLQIPPASQLALSMDVLGNGVHFPVGADPELIANRALAVNLSDLAAMAATPLCFTLGLTLPDADSDWLAGFSRGLLPLAREFNCPLVGGDLTRGPLSIAIQVQGLVSPQRVIRRHGAAIGDRVYVSGTLGDGAIALVSLGLPSALGSDFAFLDGQPGESCRQHFHAAYYRPPPRLALASALAPHVSSGLDISDGLAGDLGHLLRASGVGAVIDSAALPFSSAARCCMSAPNRLRAALYGGDDYELCVTVTPDQCAAAEAAATASGVALTRIGEIVAGSALQCRDAAGRCEDINAAAFQHFG